MNIIGKEEAYVGDDYIYVKTETKGKLLKIEFAAISYIESLKNYVAIHWGNEKILVLISLKELEQVLPKPRFMRIHKSYIISTEKIRVIEANHAFLNGVDIPIPFGDAYKLLFLEIIKKKVINN
jgi:DNA-binding LytR/AlgR family response regulator